MDDQARDPEAISSALFRAGRLGDLQEQLQRRLADDEADVRATFWLANLHAYSGDKAAAAKFAAVVGAHDWERGLAENNLAVSLIWFGICLPGIQKLVAANKLPERPAAVPFNLAVILDRVAELGGDIPPALIECDLVKSGENALEKAKELYRASLGSNEWPTGLGGALYLWPDDVPPSTGFRLSPIRPQREEAYDALAKAMADIKAGAWQSALKSLDAALCRDPSVNEAVSSLRPMASVGLHRELRARIRDLVRGKQFDQAHAFLGQITALYADIPADDLVRELMVDEIQSVGDDLRTGAGQPDFIVLQRLTSAAMRALGRLRQRATNGTADKTAARAEHLEKLAAATLEEQLIRLTQSARYDEARQFLEFGEQQWFADALDAGWSGAIAEAEARDRIARGDTHLCDGKQEDAEQEFGLARAAAEKAQNNALVVFIEGRLARLLRPAAGRGAVAEIERALAQRSYDVVLEKCAEGLREDPSNAALAALRSTALKLLLDEAKAVVQNRNWAQADKTIVTYLKHRPEDRVAQALLRTVACGQIDDRVEQAWAAWQRHDVDRARKLCSGVLDEQQRHARALELDRAIKTAETNSSAAKNGSDKMAHYHAAYFECRQAIAAGNADTAFAKACELRRWSGQEPDVQQTCHEAFTLYLREIAAERQQCRDMHTTATLAGKVRELLAVDPGHAGAESLLRDLERQEVRLSDARLATSQGALDSAIAACDEGKPKEALEALATVFDLGVHEHFTKAETVRDDALRMARTKLQRIIDTADHEGSDNAEDLTALLRRWAPPGERAVFEPLEQHASLRGASAEVDRVIATMKVEAGRPVRALRLMDREVKLLLRRHPSIPPAALTRLFRMRKRYLQTLPYLARAWFRLFSWLAGSGKPFEMAEEE